MVEQAAKQGYAELRWRSAAYVDGGEGTVQVVFTKLHLAAQDVDVACAQAETGGGVEAAVYAAASAEGDMDVYAGHFLKR